MSEFILCWKAFFKGGEVVKFSDGKEWYVFGPKDHYKHWVKTKGPSKVFWFLAGVVVGWLI